MDPAPINMKLAAIIRERAREDFGLDDPEPGVVAQFLAQSCQISIEQAEALTWGERVELDSEALDRLAAALALHRDLLACLVSPTSPELLLHALGRVAEDSLDVYDCELCGDLVDRIAAPEPLTQDEMIDLVADCLAHLQVEDSPMSEFADIGNAPDETVLTDLMRVAAVLDDDARLRVMAYAYQELAGTTDSQLARRTAGYARLRVDYLPPLARQVCDLLAASEGGALEISELVATLGLPNARALGQVPRRIRRAVALGRRQGLLVDDEVLLVVRAPGVARLRLTPSALSAWRALLRAEHNSLPAA